MTGGLLLSPIVLGEADGLESNLMVSAKWTEPIYSRSQVNKAGAAYINPATSAEERALALTVVNNWRSSHSFPLNTMQVALRRQSAKITDDALVVQRLKRLPSIVSKLRRINGMDLARMQDLGGCRVVVQDAEQVQAIDRLFSESKTKHILARRDDYMTETLREDGYRGIHRVYKYKSDKASTYNNLSIELQIRTRLQHAWATAVETVGTFTEQALKSNSGDADWLRFFSLISSDFAFREGTPPVPGTPEDRKELRKELRKLVIALDVIPRLAAYGQALQVLESQAAAEPNAKFFLLELNLGEEQKTLSIRPYLNQVQATDAYSAIESLIGSTEFTDAVLVSAQSAASLRRAYPNYFADTDVFVTAVSEAISVT